MPEGKAKEYRCFQSPSRYVQGPGLIKRLPKFAANYGKTALLIIDPFFYDEFSVSVPKIFEEAGMKTSLDKGTQRKTTENELPSLTQCTA